MAEQTRRRTLLERGLGIFTEVRAGEGVLALLMFANIFLVLSSYYILKAVREGMVVGDMEIAGIKGDELKSYLIAVMAFLLVFVVRGYGSLASRMSRIKLLNITGSFLIVCVIAVYLVGAVFKLSGIGVSVTYLVWIGIINMFIIAQFWAYAADLYTEAQGKRLFPLIAFGMTSGAWLGSAMAQAYGRKHMYELVLVSALGFAVSLILYNVANRKAARQPKTDESPPTDEEPLAKDGGFKLVFRSRYLLAIALLILVANMVNTNGEFLLSNAARTTSDQRFPDDMYTPAWVAKVEAGDAVLPQTDDAPRVIENEKQRTKAIKAARKGWGTSFFGGFYARVNLVVMLLQGLVVSRFFKFFGVRSALFVLPVIAGLGNLFIGVIGGLALIRMSKIAENGSDYSFQNTVRHALFLPTSREEKYKAKIAIDTFFVRAGDTLSALLVALGIHVLAFGQAGFALTNVALVVVWIAIGVFIARQHRKLVPAEE